ncbi:hypothetical protein LINPERHAP2_LOCUS41413 [Linum perenne]
MLFGFELSKAATFLKRRSWKQKREHDHPGFGQVCANHVTY